MGFNLEKDVQDLLLLYGNFTCRMGSAAWAILTRLEDLSYVWSSRTFVGDPCTYTFEVTEEGKAYVTRIQTARRV